LAGKTYEVSDSFLRRVRVAQFQKGMVRVVLEVDAVSDYSAFLLPNPYRLIIDIHGRKPNAPQTPLARAEQADEKRAGSASRQEEAKPEEKAEGNSAASPESTKQLVSAIQAVIERSGSTSEFGPKMADGSFFTADSHSQPRGLSDDVVHDTTHDAAHTTRHGRKHEKPQETASEASHNEAAHEAFSDETSSHEHAHESAHATPAASESNMKTSPEPVAVVPVDAPVEAHAEPQSSAVAPVAAPAGASGGEVEMASARPFIGPVLPQKSTRSEVTYLDGVEVKATDKPTTEPTVQVVAPRAAASSTPAVSSKKSQHEGEFHQAEPTADGSRSLIRALGLKVGRIVIDAGHGGHDTGTIGPGGLLEKDLVLDVSLRLGRLLQGRMGADVIYTREDDTFVPLETRTAIANEQQADLFISIHANSSPDASARGVETYYLNFNPSPDALEVAARENAVSEKNVHELGDLVKKIALKEKVEESREFATDVQHSLYQGLMAKDRSMRDRGVKKAPFIVLIGANMPSILAEISFVSNPGDERKLETPEYRQKIAESLYKGIARYINGLSGVKMASKTDGQ
jgi:N-acetylmuramoyl-L-alanine amidase